MKIGGKQVSGLTISGKAVHKIISNGNVLYYTLPSGFTRLDWIEPNSGAAIQTNIKPTAEDEIIWRSQPTFTGSSPDSTRQVVIGSRSGEWNDIPNHWFYIRGREEASANFFLCWWNLKSRASFSGPTSYTAGSFHNCSVKQTDSSVVVACDGVKVTATNGATSVQEDQPNYVILNMSAQTSATGYLTGKNYTKLAYMIIKQSGVTRGYFIPVLRNSDSKPGLYDIISDTFLTDPTGADFTYYPQVTPPTPVTGLEGTDITLGDYSFKYAFFGGTTTPDFTARSLTYDSTWSFPHWLVVWIENPNSQSLQTLYQIGHGTIDYGHRGNFTSYQGGVIDTDLTDYSQFVKGSSLTQYDSQILEANANTKGIYLMYKIEACDSEDYYSEGGRFWTKLGNAIFYPPVALASNNE